MKLNQIIAGCALAVGLMAFAPQSQAGVVYENSLFSPLSLKAVFSFTYNGKLHKVTGTSGQILKYYNYPSGTVLAYYGGDVYAINTTQGWYDDLTSYGEVYVELDEYGYSYTYPPSGGYIYNENGAMYVDFYSNGEYYDISYNNIGFYASGLYTRVIKHSAVNSHYIYSYSDSIKAPAISGEGYIYYLNGVYLETYTDLSGSASTKGSGKLVY